MEDVINDASRWIPYVAEVLHEKAERDHLFPGGISGSVTTSAVLVPLSWKGGEGDGPCMVFNKRSQRVKQPGDLCFPGGRIAPRLDPLLSRLLTIPFFPLARWPYWPRWRDNRPHQARRLANLLATSLRESFEEMRLNPLGVTFLGTLPSQSLVMFDRVIYPMVAWIPRQKRFFPNWEVERIVRIPLRDLLDPNHYACYRLRFETKDRDQEPSGGEDFPCFLHYHSEGKDVLWGATYRIAMVFLERLFGFTAPDIRSLPKVHATLGNNYYNGAD